MATKPTTAPMQVPIAEALRPLKASKKIHASAAEAEAAIVLVNAITDNLPAPNAEPALKPNHPNQSKPVPSRTYVILAGTWLGSLRRFKYKADASAAQPADI